jgi:homoserine kinase
MGFSLRLPGSTANLGPGYDVLGLALGIHNRVRVNAHDGADHQMTITGPGTEELPTDGTNLFFTSAETLAERLGKVLPKIQATMEVDVPLARGLGSSSTAIVGGVVAANHLLEGGLAQSELLNVATEIEGHPDNVSPCLYGGFTVSTISDSGVTCVRAKPAPELKAVVVVPDFQLKTEDARNALPKTVSHLDAVYNVGRACVVTAAMLQGDLEALANAMDDRLHQPYRTSLIPHYEKVTRAGLEAGALGVALSGAGPTLFAFARTGADQIGDAMAQVWESEGVGAKAYALPVDLAGTVIE